MGLFISVAYKFFRNGITMKYGRFVTPSEDLLASKEMKNLLEEFDKNNETNHAEIIVVNVRKISKDEFDTILMFNEMLKD
jgi:hypothetical protein